MKTIAQCRQRRDSLWEMMKILRINLFLECRIFPLQETSSFDNAVKTLLDCRWVAWPRVESIEILIIHDQDPLIPTNWYHNKDETSLRRERRLKTRYRGAVPFLLNYLETTNYRLSPFSSIKLFFYRSRFSRTKREKEFSAECIVVTPTKGTLRDKVQF